MMKNHIVNHNQQRIVNVEVVQKQKRYVNSELCSFVPNVFVLLV